MTLISESSVLHNLQEVLKLVRTSVMHAARIWYFTTNENDGTSADKTLGTAKPPLCKLSGEAVRLHNVGRDYS